MASNLFGFGLTRNQTKAAKMLANDCSKDEIFEQVFNVGKDADVGDRMSAGRTLAKWMEQDAFQECFRREVKALGVKFVPKALMKLYRQLDSENEWIVNKAANDILAKMMPYMMGEDSNEVVIRVEGAPKLGIPLQEEVLEADSAIDYPESGDGE